MAVTAAVLARFLAPVAAAPEPPYLGLGLPLLAIGGLFGFLATGRHVIWSFVTAAVACGAMLWEPDPKGTAKTPPVLPPPSPPYLALAIPPVALLLGSAVGSYLIGRRQHLLQAPEATD
jgi:hypothetical protein